MLLCPCMTVYVYMGRGEDHRTRPRHSGLSWGGALGPTPFLLPQHWGLKQASVKEGTPEGKKISRCV